VQFKLWDLVANLLLYAPLGVALFRQRLAVVVLASFALSAAIECSQIWSVDRFPSVFDVLANVIGCVLAALVTRRLASAQSYLPTLAVGTSGVVALAVFSTCVLILWAQPLPSTSLANWRIDYPILLGNETTGDRPWQGRVSRLAVYPVALTKHQLSAISVDEFPSTPDAVFAVEAPIQLDGTAVVVSEATSRAALERLMRQNAFSVLAYFTPANVEQSGPARIVTSSLDTEHRNFDVGQEGRKVVFRVRNAVSGRNGNKRPAHSKDVLTPNTPVLVCATFDGRVGRIFVDGVLSGRVDFAELDAAFGVVRGSALPTVWAAFGCALTIVMLRSLRARRLSSIVVVAIGCGALAAILPKVLALESVSSARQVFSPYCGALGAFAAAIAWKPSGGLCRGPRV
jgi:hypothetical protein